MNHVDPQKPMALVNIPYGDVLLNADDAMEVFRVLCKSALVEYDWASQSHRLKTGGSNTGVQLRVFTLEEYAKLALNSAD